MFVAGAPQKSGFYKYVDEIFNPSSIAWPDGPSRIVNMLTIGSESVPIAFERVTGEGAGVRTRRRLADPALKRSLSTAPIVEPSLSSPAAASRNSPARRRPRSRRASAQKRAAGILLHRILELWDGRAPIEPLLQIARGRARRRRRDGNARPQAARRSSRNRRPSAASPMPRLLGRELPISTSERRTPHRSPLREGDDDLVIDYKSGQPPRSASRAIASRSRSYCAAMCAITGRACEGLIWYIDVDVDRAIEVKML